MVACQGSNVGSRSNLDVAAAAECANDAAGLAVKVISPAWKQPEMTWAAQPEADREAVWAWACVGSPNWR